MTAESGKTTATEYLFLVICLVLTPAIMLYFALGYFEKQKNSRLLESAKIKLMEPLKKIKLGTDVETSWCATFNETLSRVRDCDEMAESIEHLARITGEQLKYVVWYRRKTIQRSNFLTPDRYKDWQNLIADMRLAHVSKDTLPKAVLENNVKALLGPHYTSEQFNRPQAVIEPHFIRADSAGRFPFVWVNDGNSSNNVSAVVLLNPDVVTRDHRLKLISSIWQHKDTGMQFISIDKLNKLAGNNSPILKTAFYNLIEKGQEISRTGNILTGTVRINQTDFVVKTIAIKEFTSNSGRNTMLITLISCFALIMALRSRPDFLQPNNISIRLQLLTLLFICSGLPLLSLSLGALEHLKQQREYLIRASYQSCLEYIQAIDRRSSGELSEIIRHSLRAVSKFKQLYKDKAAEEDIIDATRLQMHASMSEFRIVASSADYLIAHNGIYDKGTYKQYQARTYHRAKLPVEIKLINDVGSYFLRFINGSQIDPERYTELELLTEMFYKKNLLEIVHDFLELPDSISAMGWGSSAFPVFLNLIQLYKPNAVDFFFLAGHDTNNINRAFAMRQSSNLLRNEIGLNVFLYDGYAVFPTDGNAKRNSQIINIIGTAGDHPALEPQFCNYDRSSWIFAAYKGNLLNNFKILAMYPMEKIDAAIDKERDFILYSGLAALLIMVSLTLLFGHSFTVPIAHLHKAAEAVEKRDFAFKLPDLGRNEFGEMGRVFNTSIAELEELSIASIVQNRLMPDRTIESGRFDIFGRSVPMADLGGDYYDYFTVSSNSFAVLLGDVAGHGVGASLIMAMAKTGIICCADWHEQPLKVLEHLHRLICTTRSKTQRKIMTFQYLCFDKATGVGKYANAGGCSPLLVCPESASASEITLPGPVLGGFKNSKFSEIELNIKPRQALVLYTDGIIETKNPAGSEIGYERFKEWLLKHYSQNANAYYHAVYSEYLQWLGGGETQDDLTLIMLVYSGHDKPE